MKKYLDENGLLYVVQKIKTWLNGKVDKIEGKGLSTNDYTTEEKTKLGNIEAGATKTIVDASLNSTSSNPVENKAINTALSNKVDKVDGKTLTSNDFTNELKTKLDGIETGANKTVVDATLSSISENPVQNKIINAALETKVEKETGKGLSTNDYTTEEKNKLAGLSNYDDTTLSGRVTEVENTLEDKVDKVSGKGLSTNDYTTDEKNKLAGIATGAQVNKIESIKVNGTAQTITDKSVDISVPTNNNQLTNGAGYQTESEVQALINEAIGGITGIQYEIVTSLPATGEAGVIYLVSNSGSNPNSYDEYIWVNNKFEKIGTTEVDLSGYVKDEDLVAITNTEIDEIFTNA